MSLFKYYKPAKPTAAKREVTAKVSAKVRGVVAATRIEDPVARFDALLSAFKAMERPTLPRKTVN